MVGCPVANGGDNCFGLAYPKEFRFQIVRTVYRGGLDELQKNVFLRCKVGIERAFSKARFVHDAVD
jgi:hypothetical protein